MESDKKIAFALGGLAGNNAHGAGFLQAAIDLHVEPSIISLSSGQVLWVYRYLQEKSQKQHKPNLRKLLEEDIKALETTKSFDVDTALLFLFGKADVYRPAFQEFTADFLRNSIHSFRSIMDRWPNVFVTKELLDSIPGRLLVPEFPEDFFERISKALNDEPVIGMVFNSFDPLNGIEAVYLNRAARKLEAESKSKYRWRTKYSDITPEAVKDGLKLYQYGFDESNDGHLDGAYYRQIMLSELAFVTDIFVARPINHQWVGGSLPRGYAGIEDLKTKVGFNGSYAGERDKINLINKLIDDKSLGEPYKRINLIEVEIELKRGYFDYIYESLEVFDHAYKCAAAKIQEYVGHP